MQKGLLKHIIPLKSYSILRWRKQNKIVRTKVVSLDVLFQPLKFGTTFLEHFVYNFYIRRYKFIFEQRK